MVIVSAFVLSCVLFSVVYSDSGENLCNPYRNRKIFVFSIPFELPRQGLLAVLKKRSITERDKAIGIISEGQ